MLKINNIYNEDCINGMQKIESVVDLVVSDCPYLISYSSSWRKNKEHRFRKEILGDDNEQLIVDYLRECYRILKQPISSARRRPWISSCGKQGRLGSPSRMC